MASIPVRDVIHRQTQQDWANREYIEVVTGSIKKIADFLNSFDLSCRARIATLNEKLTILERQIEYLEAKVNVHAVDVTIDLTQFHGMGIAAPANTIG